MSQQEVERSLLAAEYVLGVLDPSAREAAAAAIAHDPDFADCVTYWETALSPVAASLPPVQPPAHLWSAIENQLDHRAPGDDPASSRDHAKTVPTKIIPFPVRRHAVALWRNTGFWRIAAMVAITVAVGTNFLNTRAHGSDYVAVLAPPSSEQPAFVVQSTKRHQVVLTGFSADPPDLDHSYQLWAVAGTADPVALGVIPASGDLVINRSPVWPGEGTALLVSLEPQGGSKTGSPTGPVLFSGRMIRAR